MIEGLKAGKIMLNCKMFLGWFLSNVEMSSHVLQQNSQGDYVFSGERITF